ncbi:MAG: DNA repair protein RadA [Lachnospiraceae bacterium]|nr:DNA repair protein RadA [Lachnospiraceae bacterium]
MPAKNTVFFCRECGCESSKWTGVCPGCRAFNTMVEAPKDSARSGKNAALPRRSAPDEAVRLDEIPAGEATRISTGSAELDRVLGGGAVPGSLILTGGDPGIGKSTLLLQVCRSMAAAGRRVLYVSGEESLRQIRLRADRIGAFTGDIRFLCETDLDRILQTAGQMKPEVCVIDSIQTMFREEAAGTPGSIGQVRECTLALMNYAKASHVTVFIVGHVTKEGTVAGPRMLEHMVDTVLYFEGDRHASYRVLRGVKNRFGATNEIGVFEMRGSGLAEVTNPSAFLLSGRPENVSGSVITCVMEGTRPLLLEVQGLVSRTSFGMPRRTAAGMDYNRMNLLIAVLEKRCRLSLSDCDSYINITGGIRLNDPSVDLAVVLALYSSFKNLPVLPELLVFGEVGLSGEIRSVPMTEQRVAEALRLGYTTVLLPRSSLPLACDTRGLRIVGAGTLEEAIRFLEPPAVRGKEPQ